VIQELVYSIKYILGKDLARRNVSVLPDDTFLVSYPRSGNTWTRFLVANLMYPGEAVNFNNIERLIPDIDLNSKRFLNRLPRPRVLKSHEYFDPRYPKVVNIVRDPRDVVLSYYQFHRKLGKIPDAFPLQDYVERFLRRDFDTYGTWGENVASWLSTRYPSEGFLLLRYEEMIGQPALQLAKVAALAGLDADPGRVAQAVERSSAENMRKLEKTQSDAWAVTKKARKDIPFIGKASAGQWKDALPESCVSAIEAAWGHVMEAVGYELATSPVRAPSAPLFASLSRV
jgi:Sulfotransferase domain